MALNVVARGVKRAPKHFWVLSFLIAIWTGFAAFDVTMTHVLGGLYLRRLGIDPVVIAFIARMPLWVDAIGIFGAATSFVGSILMLSRHAMAVYAFMVAFAALAISTAYLYVVAGADDVLGWSGRVAQLLAWSQSIVCVGLASAWHRAELLR